GVSALCCKVEKTERWGRIGSSWWREIVRIRDSVGGPGRFGRLFNLAETKSCSVVEIASLGWGRWGIVGVAETWQPNHDKGYTVRGDYQLMTSHDPVITDAAVNLIWHTQVPLKVSIFAWRLLRDRFETLKFAPHRVPCLNPPGATRLMSLRLTCP
ncbi:cysteine-rich receptor-like protein kinase, partial [Trifolium pratense]